MIAIFVSFLLGLLGMSYLLMGEMEARTVQRHVDRARCRLAAHDVATLAASWWNASEAGSAFLPPASEWGGSLLDWRERGDAHPFVEGLPARALVGDDGRPDLLLEDGAFLERLADTLAEGLVVERIAIFAPAQAGGGAFGRATLTVTVSAWHGALFGGRTTLVSTVEDAPALVGPELLASGGDVSIARGAELRWGLVRADGNVRLPGPEQAGHPASGLPRGSSGLAALDYSPGSHVDWNPDTSFRESLLSELIGYTSGGERLRDGESDPPRIADPWLAVQAGQGLFVGRQGRRWAERIGARQPRPHRRAEGGIEGDSSHLLQRLGSATDPLLDGRAVSVLRGSAGAAGGQQRGQRRFVLSGTQPGGEGLWAENGTGPSRPAADWLAGSVASPFLAVFTAAGGEPPARVTLHEGAGIVLVEADRVLMTATSGGRIEAVNMPGEPFVDSGIDIDGDGRVEPETVGNGRWDCDCDGDGRPDDEPPRSLMFEFVHAHVQDGSFPDGDQDPASLATAPHEPFLNLDYPVSATDPSVRVVYSDLPGASPRPVHDLDGDGTLNPMADLFTTRARDETGARIAMPLHFRGLVVNAAGSIELGPGFKLHGAVRALGDVGLLAGATLSFDEGLALEGRPAGLGLPRVHLGARSWTAGAPRLASPALTAPREREAAAPVAGLRRRGPGPGSGNRG